MKKLAESSNEYSSSSSMFSYNYIPYSTSFPNYYQNEPSLPWLHEYSNIMIKESQNFYVPSIDSPIKSDYSDSSLSFSNNTTYNHTAFIQSSPKQTELQYMHDYNSIQTISTDSCSSIYNSSFSFNNDRSSGDASYVQDEPRRCSYEVEIPRVTVKRHLNKIRKQLLSDEATEIMNAWFDDHVNNPYPHPEEKERMARAGNITVKQVTAWFSNRRNRTQNTKPKRMKREFDRQISSVFAKIVEDKPEKQLIIDQFKCTFQSNSKF